MNTVYTIITDNGGGDNNIYHDITGKVYTFPPRYRSLLTPGTKVVYHRSAKKRDENIPDRMSDASHYFGIAEIEDVCSTPDGNYRAYIINYSRFKYPVGIHREDGTYYERNPFFQQGVRKANFEIYEDILAASEKAPVSPSKRRGPKTCSSLNTGVESNVITYEGREYGVVTGRNGYFLKSPDSIFYELKHVINFTGWNEGTLKIIRHSSGEKFLIMHDRTIIGTLTPFRNGMRFYDVETEHDVNVNM